MDAETKEFLLDFKAKLDEMYELFTELKPMIARYKMVSEASNLREARKVLKSGR